MAQLHSGMLTSIRDQLEEAVRQYGMRSFIYHDVLAKEVFSRGFCSAGAGMEAWSSHLCNGSGDDDPLATCHFI